LGGQYDPGHFVFDYFNDAQLYDLAQSLGGDPSVNRQVVREGGRNIDTKFTLKILEVNAGVASKLAETTNFAGSLHTAVLIDILARLNKSEEDWEGRLIRLSRTGTDEMRGACENAASRRTWVMIEGRWRVEGEEPSLLHFVPEPSSSHVDAVSISVEVPARSEELTHSGRVRIRPGREVEAAVFAQPETWVRDERRFTAIAHAVFARLGDPRFEWSSAKLWSTGDSSNGDF
jgi:hypothetical protein